MDVALLNFNLYMFVLLFFFPKVYFSLLYDVT